MKQDSIPLDYTPRKFLMHPQNGLFYLIEADHRAYGEESSQQQLERLVRTYHPRAFWLSLLRLTPRCALAGGAQDLRRGDLEPASTPDRTPEGTRRSVGVVHPHHRPGEGTRMTRSVRPYPHSH